MNALMHIQRDSDVTKLRLADSAEVEQFESGEGDGPVLDPMRPYFGKHFLKKGWHHTLRSLFVERMQQDYAPFNETEEDNIGDMFDERIGHLRRQWVHQMKMSENDMEREVALRAAQGRASTRRVTVSSSNGLWRCLLDFWPSSYTITDGRLPLAISRSQTVVSTKDGKQHSSSSTSWVVRV